MAETIKESRKEAARNNLRKRGLELTAQIPQYKILIRTSIGALTTARVFFHAKNREERKTSLMRPKTKVAVARPRPIILYETVDSASANASRGEGKSSDAAVWEIFR